MTNKLFFTIFILFFMTFNQVYAIDKFTVELVDDIDITNPPQECSLRVIQDIYINYYDKIEKGSIITGKIIKIVPPKRWERDAFVAFKAEKYTVPSENNKEVEIFRPKKIRLRNKRERDKKDLAVNTFGTALSCFPPFTFIVPVAQFGMGIVRHRENEHPFRAGCRYLVESWPFCYFLKGKDISLDAGTKMEIPFNEKMFDFKKKSNIKKEAI